MMTVQIKKSALRIAAWLYYGGLIVMYLSVPHLLWEVSHADGLITKEWISMILFSWLFPGCVITAIGGALKTRLFRCPNCGGCLLSRGKFNQEMPQKCDRCGEQITICLR